MGSFNQNIFNSTLFGSSSGRSTETGRTLIDLTQVNSTTYVDLLGVLLGLERITGEPSESFLDRLAEAVNSSRGGEYVGLLNEIRLNLGLPLNAAIRIDSSDHNFEVSVSLAGVFVTSPAVGLRCPLLTIDSDNVWVWRRLSDIVADINSTGLFTAELLTADAPAIQLARQSNESLAIAEPVEGKAVKLQFSALVEGSEVFSKVVPEYSYSSDRSVLYFDRPVPPGATVSYRYRRTPYTLVSCPVSLIGMTDPALHKVAIGSDGQLTYQVREFIQALVDRDRSYWAR